MYYDDDERGGGGGCVPGALIVAAALLAVAAIFYFGINRAADTVSNPFGGRNLNPLAPQPTVIKVDRPAVIQEIRALNRLESASVTIEKVIEAGSASTSGVFNLLMGDRLLLIAHGEVIAGFDLGKLREEDIIVSADGASATITLPPAEILVSRLDNEQTRVYDRQRGLMTKGSVDLETEARRVAEQEILRAACEDGILKRAVEEGRRDMENLVKAFGIATVTVVAREGPCTFPGGAPLPTPEATAQPSP